jgi:hypothetical protein
MKGNLWYAQFCHNHKSQALSKRPHFHGMSRLSAQFSVVQHIIKSFLISSHLPIHPVLGALLALIVTSWLTTILGSSITVPTSLSSTLALALRLILLNSLPICFCS